jgi:hypothetical protein
MHFLNTIIVALVASGAAAFTLPASLKDSMYSAHYDKEGRKVHERLATANNSALNTQQEAPSLEGRSLGPFSKR